MILQRKVQQATCIHSSNTFFLSYICIFIQGVGNSITMKPNCHWSSSCLMFAIHLAKNIFSTNTYFKLKTYEININSQKRLVAFVKGFFEGIVLLIEVAVVLCLQYTFQKYIICHQYLIIGIYCSKVPREDGGIC